MTFQIVNPTSVIQKIVWLPPFTLLDLPLSQRGSFGHQTDPSQQGSLECTRDH